MATTRLDTLFIPRHHHLEAHRKHTHDEQANRNPHIPSRHHACLSTIRATRHRDTILRNTLRRSATPTMSQSTPKQSLRHTVPEPVAPPTRADLNLRHPSSDQQRRNRLQRQQRRTRVEPVFQQATPTRIGTRPRSLSCYWVASSTLTL